MMPGGNQKQRKATNHFRNCYCCEPNQKAHFRDGVRLALQRLKKIALQLMLVQLNFSSRIFLGVAYVVYVVHDYAAQTHYHIQALYSHKVIAETYSMLTFLYMTSRPSFSGDY